MSSAQYRVTNMSDASEASLAYAIGVHQRPVGRKDTRPTRPTMGSTFQDEINDITQGLMGWRDISRIQVPRR